MMAIVVLMLVFERLVLVVAMLEREEEVCGVFEKSYHSLSHLHQLSL